MTEQGFRELLHEALFLYAEEGSCIDSIRTYEQEKFLSTHSGLIVRITNGEVFNLMVMKDVGATPYETVGETVAGSGALLYITERSGTEE
jgi:hypothetical protein